MRKIPHLSPCMGPALAGPSHGAGVVRDRDTRASPCRSDGTHRRGEAGTRCSARAFRDPATVDVRQRAAGEPVADDLTLGCRSLAAISASTATTTPTAKYSAGSHGATPNSESEWCAREVFSGSGGHVAVLADQRRGRAQHEQEGEFRHA